MPPPIKAPKRQPGTGKGVQISTEFEEPIEDFRESTGRLRMEDHSIWNAPLESLYQDLAGRKPSPAGVTAAAVSARLGLGLLIKTLEIIRNRKSFSGDAGKFQAMIDAAHEESTTLARAADDDISADAARKRSEIPLRAARAAESGLALCAEAAEVVTGAVAADLAVATLLLKAGLASIRRCLQSNLDTQAPDTQARP